MTYRRPCDRCHRALENDLRLTLRFVSAGLRTLPYAVVLTFTRPGWWLK